jgi:DNA repair exonuclease SbcCD ATPase subunit
MIILKRLRVENFKLLARVELAFPRQGSVLVEGLNESGKSTLFESVYYALYGVPLIMEGRGRGTLESVIRYGADAMLVELALEVDETELEVQRALKRGRSSQATLVIRGPGGEEERVSGVTAVNERIVAELGGLDGDALLNSCFVEQKKVSKLEELGASQRRESLRKLLNLDRLTGLAERFKVTSQEERALEEARRRLELAEVSAKLPEVVSERAELEARLGNVTLAPSTISARMVDAGGGRFPPAWAEGDASEDGEEASWHEMAAGLDSARAREGSARRGGVALAALAASVLIVAVGLLLAGMQQAAWMLPAVLVLGVAAAVVHWSVRERIAERIRLEIELARRRDALLARLGDLEGRRARAEATLGTEADSLDVEECRREVARMARELEVKRRAYSIVEGTMERIVRLVLPNTERNLGQILPLLTAGRYHEARIGADYQIQVWDDSAGRYVSKNLFSGGARDQFSLALRLAFALATLPEELGTTPGFIFLDEPLSSFDGPRTEALVRLLTTGQVAESFSQIFVISHSRSFDPSAFQCRLEMRDGRVVESNLPEV